MFGVLAGGRIVEIQQEAINEIIYPADEYYRALKADLERMSDAAYRTARMAYRTLILFTQINGFTGVETVAPGRVEFHWARRARASIYEFAIRELLSEGLPGDWHGQPLITAGKPGVAVVSLPQGLGQGATIYGLRVRENASGNREATRWTNAKVSFPPAGTVAFNSLAIRQSHNAPGQATRAFAFAETESAILAWIATGRDLATYGVALSAIVNGRTFTSDNLATGGGSWATLLIDGLPADTEYTIDIQARTGPVKGGQLVNRRESWGNALQMATASFTGRTLPAH